MHGMQAQMQQLRQGVACVEGHPFSFLSGLTALRLCPLWALPSQMPVMPTVVILLPQQPTSAGPVA